MNLIGTSINGFKIISILGEGGMGIVYKAFDTKLERYVAIKMLHPRTNKPERLLSQFKKEAKHQARLVHPNIITVYGLLEYQSLLGIVMEYVEGRNLNEIIFRNGKIEPAQATKFLIQILMGIEYAHSKGFVHRDIKPSNILIDSNGTLKIMDFGISKSLFDTSGVETPFSKMGTIFYISPEQIRGESASISSDIYAIGCTAYEMLTGFSPFFSTNEFDVMEGHLRKTPAHFSNFVYGVPDWLDTIIFKSLEKNPQNRYYNCGIILKEIYRNSNSVSTPLPAAPQRTTMSTSYKVIRFIIVLILIAILISVSYYVVKRVETTRQTEQKADSTKQQPIERFLR